MTRRADDLLADLAEAVDAAAEVVQLGKKRWDNERPLRLAGEAIISRLGDITSKLPDEVIEATPENPGAQPRTEVGVSIRHTVPLFRPIR